MVLSYVFWHAAKKGVDERLYRETLIEFHRTFQNNPPAGFLSSHVFTVPSVPWLPGHTPVYEDWYLLDGSAALDNINEAAVLYPRQTAHDGVARLAAAGTAGLYRLRAGTTNDLVVQRALWFAKPDSENYETFFRRFLKIQPVAFALWGRQMTLGPTPEFCLQLDSTEEGNWPLPTIQFEPRRIW